MAALTETHARLARQLEERSKEVKEVNTFLKNERAEQGGRITFTPSPDN
jgi:hypothetical protein